MPRNLSATQQHHQQGQEGSRRHPKQRDRQRPPGGAGRPHHGAARSLGLGFGCPFQKLPPPPPTMHPGPWLRRFDPTAHVHSTGI